MGYQVIDVGDVDPLPDRPSRALEISDHYVAPDDSNTVADSDPSRGPEQFGLRVYEAEPGEQLPNAYHYHEEQEEAFFVLDGQLHVETPEGEHVVREDQAFVVEPGSPHRAFNPDDSGASVRVLAIGAPSYSALGYNDAQVYDPDA